MSLASNAIALTPQVEREYRALKASAGIRQLGELLFVKMVGEDRVSFMHGMCTADIKGLTPGHIMAALFLTDHAHVIAACNVYAENDAFLLEVERASWKSVRDHLEKFLVADDVEMEEQEDLAAIDIEGSNAAEAVRQLAGDSAASLPPWGYDQARRIGNVPRCGAPAFTFIVEQARVAAEIEKLKTLNPSLVEVSESALEIVRVEQGLARVGIDTASRTLALEGRFERAISFDKGCYVGQETVERATARGALKHRLYGLRITDARMPATGAAVMLGGKEVGRLTSVVHSPALGLIGLAILHHSAWNAGASVDVRDSAGQVAATVSELPFTS